MKSAQALLGFLAARLNNVEHLRLVLFDGQLAVEFSVGGRGSRYGLAPADLDRPSQDLADEIAAHHAAYGNDSVRVPLADVAAEPGR